MLKAALQWIRRRWTCLFRAATWLAAAAIFFSSPSLALAQTGGAVASDKGYVNQYALVILLVGLALMVVCRPSGRPTQLKPLERYVDE